jgi:hypothetical protein
MLLEPVDPTTNSGRSEMKPQPFPSLAFVPVPNGDRPIEIVVNFGIFAGRAASPAEIDRLGEWLLDTTDAVTIVCEERHEIGGNAEATVLQVRIEIGQDAVPTDPFERAVLEDRLLERANYWARACIADH